jgi:hypothetical protein
VWFVFFSVNVHPCSKRFIPSTSVPQQLVIFSGFVVGFDSLPYSEIGIHHVDIEGDRIVETVRVKVTDVIRNTDVDSEHMILILGYGPDCREHAYAKEMLHEHYAIGDKVWVIAEEAEYLVALYGDMDGNQETADNEVIDDRSGVLISSRIRHCYLGKALVDLDVDMHAVLNLEHYLELESLARKTFTENPRDLYYFYEYLLAEDFLKYDYYREIERLRNANSEIERGRILMRLKSQPLIKPIPGFHDALSKRYPVTRE